MESNNWEEIGKVDSVVKNNDSNPKVSQYPIYAKCIGGKFFFKDVFGNAISMVPLSNYKGFTYNAESSQLYSWFPGRFNLKDS